MRGMINDKRFADVIFKVGHHEVWSHRALLAAHSEYLAAKFSGPWLDRDTVIDIDGMGEGVFINVILYYVYTGEFQPPALEDVPAVIHYSDLWQLSELCAFVVEHVKTLECNPGRVHLEILSLAHRKCVFDGTRLNETRTPKLWSSLYVKLLDTWRAHCLDIIEADPSVVQVLRSYDMMYVALECIKIDSLTDGALVHLGHVVLLWLKGDCGESSLSDILFEVLEHWRMCHEPCTTGFKLQLGESKLGLEGSAAKELAGFVFKLDVCKSGEKLECSISQEGSTEVCDFRNQWPCPISLGISVLAARSDSVIVQESFLSADRKPKHLRVGLQGTVVEYDNDGDAYIDFFEVGRQWVFSSDFKKLQFGCTLPLRKDLFNSFTRHSRKLAFSCTLPVACEVEAVLVMKVNPLVELCLAFTACAFPQLSNHPRMPLLSPAMLQMLLRSERLNVKSELEVLTIAASAANAYPCKVEDLISSVLIPYISFQDLADVYSKTELFQRHLVIRFLPESIDGVQLLVKQDNGTYLLDPNAKQGVTTQVAWCKGRRLEHRDEFMDGPSLGDFVKGTFSDGWLAVEMDQAKGWFGHVLSKALRAEPPPPRASYSCKDVQLSLEDVLNFGLQAMLEPPPRRAHAEMAAVAASSCSFCSCGRPSKTAQVVRTLLTSAYTAAA